MMHTESLLLDYSIISESALHLLVLEIYVSKTYKRLKHVQNISFIDSLTWVLKYPVILMYWIVVTNLRKNNEFISKIHDVLIFVNKTQEYLAVVYKFESNKQLTCKCGSDTVAITFDKTALHSSRIHLNFNDWSQNNILSC